VEKRIGNGSRKRTQEDSKIPETDFRSRTLHTLFFEVEGRAESLGNGSGGVAELDLLETFIKVAAVYIEK